MRTWGSADAVIAALRDDAAAERERLERESAAAIETLAAAPRAAAPDPVAAERLDAVRRAAAEAEAAEDWEDTSMAVADRDVWIVAIAAAGRAAIAGAPDPQPWLERLALEAAARLPSGEPIAIVVPAACLGGAGAWRARVEAATGHPIALEAGTFAAGCLARTRDGRVTFDNTIDARERRARMVWRGALARLYDRAVTREPVGAE